MCSRQVSRMEIKILGTGCPKCNAFEKTVRNVLKELGVNATVTKVDKVEDIVKYGVFATPGLVINEKLVSQGKVLTREELIRLIANELVAMRE
jgi:small redox-active disulfide protein 2